MMRPGIALAALLALSACANAPAPQQVETAAAPIPSVLRISLNGRTDAVLQEESKGHLALKREGSDEPVMVEFQNGQPIRIALAPGNYSLASMGTLRCEGMGFDVPAGAPGRALGSLDAVIVATQYFVALPKQPRTEPGDAAALAAELGVAPTALDAAPLAVSPSATCYVGRNQETSTWTDLPVGDKVLLGILMAGFCAAAVAAGGFCIF